MLNGTMQTGNCFRCRQAGHWINDCPLKSYTDDPPPAIQCPCGGGFCEIKVANTRENPGRKFYKCPTAQNCCFFKWCDKVTDEDIKFRPAFTIPICSCGAGPCRRVKDVSGRAYLICCIKKGFGACGFFKWEDVEMIPSCDVMDEIDFWVEADQILSDVESSFQARGGVIPEIANQMASEKECQASVSGIEDDCVVECQDSVSAEDDSTLENLDSISMSVSDVHSTALNQGISLFDPVTSEPEEPWKKTQNGDQPTNSALSKLSVDEAMSDLIRDTVSSGSVVIHGRTNHEQPEIDGAEWSFPCLQNLIDQYNSEKLQLESISGKHVQMLSEFMASYRRLRLLHEKTSHLRKTLLETEKEMVCCEAETLEFGASCREVAGEMAESQKRMQETADKLGKEVEVFKHNEFVGLKRRRT
ncbi:putative DNA topoisomerase transcription factor interactor and regulator CCHC(Zn) family [Arabidopsis thaliana]|uniref:Uncharacterized protein n=3 Tax=Arabidopsis TaxID=3701 RepID=A0A178UK38_ARATH|nr:Zinc finger CCHC-type [Arabidopsis thaliana x Arabidopsis arenosa]KAG7609122.1 Zinc finger CCHC-type [Arabidopsis suecica]OAO93637.1 hypothetical protein AXX17_AT5G13350 [Arabidopsis thaliana]